MMDHFTAAGGVNFDTARIYAGGKSEEMAGRVMAGKCQVALRVQWLQHNTRATSTPGLPVDFSHGVPLQQHPAVFYVDICFLCVSFRHRLHIVRCSFKLAQQIPDCDKSQPIPRERTYPGRNLRTSCQVSCRTAVRQDFSAVRSCITSVAVC